MTAVQHSVTCPGASVSTAPLPGQAFRLASGIFYDHAALDGAVSDLLRRGFTRRDMCFAGTRDALGAIGGAFALSSAGAPKARLRPLFLLSADTEVVATSGALLRHILKEAPWREGSQRLASSWLLPDLFGRFKEHMYRNAVVLLVGAPDADLQRESSRILLRRSAHTVQTHEFTLAHTSGK
jgi:hypothetical protein